MRLLHRILMILSVTIIGCLLLAIFSMDFMTHQLTQFLVQREYAEKSKAIDKYIEMTNQEFRNRIYDNAVWDDLYSHLKAKNHPWIEDNCTLFLYEEAEFDVDLVYIESDDQQYVHYYSHVGDHQWMKGTAVYQKVLESDEVLSDYVYDEGHLIQLLASKVKNNEETDSSGILILGRFMDVTITEHLPDFIGRERLGEISFRDPLEHAPLSEDHQLLLRYDFDNQSGETIKQLVTEVSFKDLQDQIRLFAQKVIVAITIAAFAALFMIALTARKMTRQMEAMISEIHNISNGEYESHLEMSSIEEINLLAKSINKLSTDMRDHKERLEKSYFEGIQTLIKALETVDAYTKGHSERVAYYTVAIARAMGMDDEVLENYRMAALMHDFGKIGVPGNVLNKVGKLTPEEFELIRRHPLTGYEILDISHMFSEFKEIIKYHHERYDGNGYPMKLSGKNIPIGARILAVADTFDAMTSDRAYRDALPLYKAIEIIRREKGKQFDPEVVEVFLSIAETIFEESNRLFGHSIT